MPQLTDAQIEAIGDQLIAQAPEGLSESEFNAWMSERMDAALAPEPRTMTDKIVDALPVIGGVVGGIAGAGLGPLAVGTAAIGGAGGEGWRRTIQGLRGKRPEAANESVSDTLSGVAKEGAKQGVYEAMGGLTSKALQRGGRAVYRSVLKPRDAVVAKYGDVTKDLIKRGRLVTEGGARKSGAALKASKAEADAIIDAASGQTPYITPSDAAKYFGDVEDTLKLRALGGQADEVGKVARRRASLQSMKAKTGVGLDVKEANAVKRELDRAADGAQRRISRGVATQESANDLLNDATRKGLKEAIEKVADVGPVNAETRKLMGETTALRHAVKRTGNSFPLGTRDLVAVGIGGGAGAASGDTKVGTGVSLLTRLLMSPRGGSLTAIGLDRLGGGGLRTGKYVNPANLARLVQMLLQESDK